MDDSNSNIFKLNSSNYPLWKTFIEDLLYDKDLYDLIGSATAKLKETSNVNWNTMNRMEVAMIGRWLDMSVYTNVEAKMDDDKMWNNLKELYVWTEECAK